MEKRNLSRREPSLGRLPPRVGVVLAGGQSRRFGSPKAWAEYQGKPFIHHLHDLLSGIFPHTYVALNRPDPKYDGMNTLVDLLPEGGPMNAIYSALKQTKASSIFVTACDLPLLGDREIRYLLDHWREDYPALAYQREGHWEPLCGIYNATLLPQLQKSLAGNEFSLKRLLDQSGAQALAWPEDRGSQGLRNINTVEDYQELVEPPKPAQAGP